MRKGAPRFVLRVPWRTPSAVAVHLRAGWAFGGVQDRNLRHGAAGDMFVGQTVSGLPILQPEFSALPPHFPTGIFLVHKKTRLCFPGLPHFVGFIGEFSLDSMIYHLDFLRHHLPGSHHLFQSPLFADPDLVDHLRLIVKTDGPDGEGSIHPTGVPPHLTILSELRAARNALRNVAS
jgi:hypothetical protein